MNAEQLESNDMEKMSAQRRKLNVAAVMIRHLGDAD
jgi:hypothetical protein